VAAEDVTRGAEPRPVVIVGPTAGGKSALAVALAARLAAAGQPRPEVVSADSMQVYRHLDAGTAKPTPGQRAAVRHHLVDVVEPTERFTVADWLARAETAIGAMRGRGTRPIVVGGTNLYVKALLEGLFEGPPVDPDVRARLERLWDERGEAEVRARLARADPQAVVGGTNLDVKALLEGLFDGPEADASFRKSLEKVSDTFLHERLAAVDAAAAARIAVADRRRAIRALEVYHLTGRPLSEQQKEWEAEPRAYRYDPVLVGLRWPVAAINGRINLRVKAMFYPEKVEAAVAAAVLSGGPGGESLPDEVRRLDAAGLLPAGSQAAEALGYKQVLAWLHRDEPNARYADRQIRSLEDAFERTKVLTRRFAKQQRTWLKRYRGVRWLEAEGADAEALAEQAAEAVLAAA